MMSLHLCERNNQISRQNGLREVEIGLARKTVDGRDIVAIQIGENAFELGTVER